MAVEEVGIRVNLQQRREAAVGLKDIRGNLSDVADAGEDVASASASAARGLEKASSRRFARGFSAIGRGVRSVSGFLGRGLVAGTKAAAVGVVGLTVAVGALSSKAIALAGDARETGSAFDTVFGRDARAVQKNLDQLTKKFGLYNPELQDAARQFGVFGKAAGVARKELPAFSSDLVQAGLDLSSFYNANPGETFQALQSGLSGEAEPLRQFGIFISDATMKTKAASMGLTGTLTEQQKVMVRQRLIMDSLGDAQGDLARTSQGFANQQRSATGRVKTFLQMLGGPLTTAATGAYRGLNAIAKSGIRELRKRLPGLEKDAKRLSQRFQRWGREFGHDLPGNIRRLSKTWDTLTDKVRAFMAQGGRNELHTLGGNMRDLGPAVKSFAAELPGLKSLLAVTAVVTGFLADHTDLLAKAMPYLVAGFVALKVAQLGANIAAAASLPMKVADIVATRSLTKALRELSASQVSAAGATAAATGATATQTAAESTGIIAKAKSVVVTGAKKAAELAAAGASKAMAAAQWLVNAAMSANPIGLVVIAIAALVAGLVIAYKKSDTFRRIVNAAFGAVWGAAKTAFDWIKDHWKLLLAIITGPIGIAVGLVVTHWDKITAAASSATDFIMSALGTVGGFIKRVFVGYLRLIATGFILMARVGLKSFTWLLKAAFATFNGILTAAAKGLGWVPGLGDKIGDARAAFDRFGDATINKLDALGDKLKGVQQKVNDLARDRSATVSINVVTTGMNNSSHAAAVHNQLPSTQRTVAPRRIAAPRIPAVPAPQRDDDVLELTPVGRAQAPRGRDVTHVQVVLPNGKVLAETVVDHLKKKNARG